MSGSHPFKQAETFRAAGPEKQNGNEPLKGWFADRGLTEADVLRRDIKWTFTRKKTHTDRQPRLHPAEKA